MRLLEDNTRGSQTIINSPDFIPPLSSLMELKPIPGNPITRNLPYHKTTTGLKFATNSTLEHARTLILIANIDMSAKTATSLAIPKRTAHLNLDEVHGLQPKYLHHNLWLNAPSVSPTTAEWSETAQPLPRPPFRETSNPIALKTITDNPTLFQVKTLVNFDSFQSLLKTHPNPDFVNSVCMGLHEGFWPWADTVRGHPVSHDNRPRIETFQSTHPCSDDAIVTSHNRLHIETFRSAGPYIPPHHRPTFASQVRPRIEIFQSAGPHIPS